MSDVRQFLQRIDLDQYGDMFEKASVDRVVLASLTDGDLQTLGVEHFLHRRKILLHAAQWVEGEAGPSAEPESGALRQRRPEAAAVQTGDDCSTSNPGRARSGFSAQPRRGRRRQDSDDEHVADDDLQRPSGDEDPRNSARFQIVRALLIFLTFVLLQYLWDRLTTTNPDAILEAQRIAQLKAACPPGVDCVRMWQDSNAR